VTAGLAITFRVNNDPSVDGKDNVLYSEKMFAVNVAMREAADKVREKFPDIVAQFTPIHGLIEFKEI